MIIWPNEESSQVSFLIPIILFIKFAKFISDIYIIQLYFIGNKNISLDSIQNSQHIYWLRYRHSTFPITLGY